MKVVCTADWHIHAFSDFSRDLNVIWDEDSKHYVESDSEERKIMSSRLFNVLNGICDIRDYCVENNIVNVLNAGDVFHKRGNINVDTFNAAFNVIKSFQDCGIQLYIIAGNHDQTDSSDVPTSSIHTFSDIANIIEHPESFEISDKNDKLSVVGIPYSKNKNFVLESLKSLSKDTKNSILMVHLGMTGAAVGSGMYVMNDEYSMKDLAWDKWKYVVMGHYHKPQLLSHNTFYCGTPVQNSFNDEMPEEENGGYNGFFVVDTSKRYDIEFVPVIKPRFVTIKQSSKYKNLNSENYYRVTVTPEQVEQVTSKVEKSKLNVKIITKKSYESEARSEIGIEDSFHQSIEKYVNENYKGEDKSVILSVGLDVYNQCIQEGE